MPGFGSMGIGEIVLILAILLLVFGARRLPEIGSALGKGIREFKSSVREIESEINRPSEPASRELPRSEAPRQEPAPPREVETTRPASSEQAPRQGD